MLEESQEENLSKKSSSEPSDLTESFEDLLKKWLSVAESQICALEVLCIQIPKLNTMLEENMVALSTSFGTIASHAQNLPEQLDAINEAAKQGNGSLEQEVEKAKSSANEMMSALSQAIVGMQFQDRVSQNLVIAEKVSKEIVTYLNDPIDLTIYNLPDHGETSLDKEFAKKIISHLTLGELQHKFVDHLITHKYIKDPSQIGLTEESLDKKSNDEDDIELF